MTFAMPGMWTYLKSMGATVNYIGWGFAAFPFGTWLASRYLRDSPLGQIKFITKVPDGDTEKLGKVKRTKTKPYGRSAYGLLMVIAITGNIVYAMGPSPEIALIGRVLAGIGASAIVLTQRYIEFSTGGDEVVVRSRMVMFGAVQAGGAVAGVVLAVIVGAIPPFAIVNHELSSQPVGALVVAALYLLLLPGVYVTYDAISPKKDVIDYVDQVKGEIDAPPTNYMPAQRLGVLIPAIVYDRGQARPSSLPDVFSTAVVLVQYFMLNNIVIGIEVAHGPLCDDLYGWGALDTSITYLAFMAAMLIGIMLSLSLSDEVPCNRRVFGSFVMMFVTFGLMLQPATPKEQYIGFLVLIAACYSITDLALTEIHVDKIGEEDDSRMTASNKQMVMSWLNSTASFTRMVSAIITGYIYSYWSESNHLSRRPYAVYGCGFGVTLLLVMMTVIFYKRFTLRQLENQVVPPSKMLEPQVINCLEAQEQQFSQPCST